MNNFENNSGKPVCLYKLNKNFNYEKTTKKEWKPQLRKNYKKKYKHKQVLELPGTQAIKANQKFWIINIPYTQINS